MPNKNYKNTGWGFIILSIFCVVIFLVDYKIKFIFDLTSISELGTILGGTSGLFASLAGLFFVLENLEMQRETISHQQVSIDLQRQELKNQILEMKESNNYFKEQTETLKTQTAESTFFQLLENHRSLVISLHFGEESGYAGLTKYYKTLKLYTQYFIKASITGDVNKCEYASYYPVRGLKPQIENIEQLYSNTFHLIKLIKLKLNDEIFYHETFYNSLSKAEKYIIGLYCVNEKTESLSIFQNDKFNYLEYFESIKNGYFNKKSTPFFPELNFIFSGLWYKFYFKNYKSNKVIQDSGGIIIKVINNEFKYPVILKNTIFEYDWLEKKHSILGDWGLEINEPKTINIFSQINSHVLKKIANNSEEIRKSMTFQFPFKIIFVIVYNSREYRYTQCYNLKLYNMNEQEADLQILQTS